MITEQSLSDFLIGLITLAPTLILLFITGRYARSTFRMLEEMRLHSHLLALSVAASVNAGMLQLPDPDNVRAFQRRALNELEIVQEQIEKLLMQLPKRTNLE